MSSPTDDEMPRYGEGEVETVEVVEVVDDPLDPVDGPDERSMLGGVPKWTIGVVLGGLLLVGAITAGALSGGLPSIPGLGGGEETVAESEEKAGDEDDEDDAGGKESAAQICVDASVGGVANVRSGPSTDHDVVDTLATGDEILYEATEDGWVELLGGDRWVSEEVLCP